jgi:hypothetical protein
MARESSRVAESHVIKAESQIIKEECDSLFINLKVKQNPEGSAESLNVEDGDEIDAMLSQIGGDKHRHYNKLLYTPVPSPALPPHSLQLSTAGFGHGHGICKQRNPSCCYCMRL